MIRWWRRRIASPEFTARGPTLAERLAAVRHDPRWAHSWLARAVRMLLVLALAPFRFLGSMAALLVGRAMEWTRTAAENRAPRRLGDLLLGLPALLALVGIVTLAAVSRAREPRLVGTYQSAAWTALTNEREDEARLLFERLFYLDGGTATTRYGFARALEEVGDTERSAAMLNGAAELGSTDACLLLARRSIEDESRPPAERLRTARELLLRAERSSPDDIAVLLELAKSYLAAGEPRAALPRLARAARTEPQLLPDLAKLYALTGQPDAARQALTRSVEHSRTRLATFPDDVATRIRLAEALSGLGQLGEAQAVLHAGYRLDPTGPFGALLARLLISVYDQSLTSPTRDDAFLLNLIKDALAYDPRSADAAMRLATFGEQPESASSGVASSAASAEAEAMLRSLLVSGEAPAVAHMALGIRAWRADRVEDATWHFEQAYELDGSLTGVANNLAWMLAHREPPELERALGIIDSVVAQRPEVASFRDTRGEILLRLGRPQEAVAEFERALPSMRGDARLRRSLATAYDQLNQPEMARLHLAEAERLQAAGAENAKP